MGKSENAVALFNSGGAHCAQAVLFVFCRESGLDEDVTLRLAEGLGAGVGRTDGARGAVIAAAVVIGLKVHNLKDSKARREHVHALVREFIGRFETLHNSVSCTSLLGFDLRTPEGRAGSRRLDASNRICPGLVASAVNIIEDLF